MLVFPMLLALVLLHEARLVDLSFKFELHSSVSLISVKIPQGSDYPTIRSRFSTCLSASFSQISSTSAFNVSLAYLLCWTLLAPIFCVSHFQPHGSRFLIPCTRFLLQVFLPSALCFLSHQGSTLRFFKFSNFSFLNYIPTSASPLVSVSL